MRVFKFGGASVKDAASIKNVKTVLETTGFDNLVVVVSAMGKMTNALEVVVSNYLKKSPELQASLSEVFDYHNKFFRICFQKSHMLFTVM
jgi:aspartate kinase